MYGVIQAWKFFGVFMMKRFIQMVLVFCLLVGTVEVAAGAAPVNVKEHTRQVNSCLRKMQRAQRDALLSEMRGLLFMENGSSAYSSKKGSELVEVKQRGKVVAKERVPFYYVQQGAKFIGGDGKLYDFYAARRGGTVQKQDVWKHAKLHIYRAGNEAAFESFAEELLELEVQRGIYFLRQMSPVLRQALFAEVLGLLYLEGGQDAYTGKTKYSTISGERVPYPEYRNCAKYMDAQGNEQGIAEVRTAENERGKAWRTWWPGVKLNMHRAGLKPILAPFKAEIKAMREYAAKVKGHSGFSPVPGVEK